MSYLSLPQINFKGTAYCNPSTADNNDLADVFDIDSLEFKPSMYVIPGASVDIPAKVNPFLYAGPASSPDCRTWLMGLLSNVPGEITGQQSHWNYYGDHGTRLDDTTVTTISPRPGVTVPANDPLLSATVSLIGTPSPMQFQDPVIVDNDPYALITSQIFSYGFTVTGTDQNGNPVTYITANPTTRSYAYYINVQKNLDPNTKGFQMVSAIFLLGVPSGPGSNIVINTSVNSPALTDLAAALAQGTGLQMRFIFYDAIYKISPADLQKSFAAGNYIANPYIGTTLGTIGVLTAGDMLSAPPGRKLNLQTAIPYQLAGPLCGTSSTPSKNSGNVNLGITLANLDLVNESVTLDCISTFPECNEQTQSKYNFGPMLLNLNPTGGGQPITLGTIPNDTASYQQNAGMVSIPLASHPQLAEIKAAAATGTLAIHSVNLNQDVLVESTGLDIQTEDRASYFDVKTLTNWADPNEQPVPGTSTITLQVFRQGVPVQDAVTINIEHWMCAKDQVNPSKPQCPVQARYFTINGATQIANTPYKNAFYDPTQPNSWSNQPNYSVPTDQIVIPASSNGRITLTLSGVNSGTSILRFVDSTLAPVFPNFCWDNTDYACIRILPFDDYRAVPNTQVNNWPYIYANFFNYFALLYPIMSEVIPWGPLDAPNNPDVVKQFAAQMKVFTNPTNWNTTIYMPITRDLSAGKRALLWRWCSLQGA